MDTFTTIIIILALILFTFLILLVITIRRKAEKELRKQSQKIGALVETSQDWIWETDLEGVHTYSNPGVEKILGYTPNEIINKPAFDLIDEEDLQKIKIMLKQCVEEKRGWSDLVICWHHKDGSVRYLESNAVPVLDEMGGIIGFSGINRDITQAKLDIQQLRESEKRYRALFESANDAIFLMKDNTFIDCNPKTEEIFACSKDKLIGQTPFIFSSEIQPDGEKSEIKGNQKIKAAFAGKPQIFEWQHIKFNGKPFDAEVSLNLLDLPSGKHLLAIVRDISIRKFTEAALSKSEARYRNIVEDQTEFIVRWRPDGTRIFVNNSYCQYFGLSLNEAIGTSFFSMIDEQDKKNVKERISGLTLKNPVSTGEHRIRLKDGSIGWQRWTDRAIFNEQGGLLEYQSVGMDITESKRAEEAVRESEERLKLAASATKLGTFDWYPDEDKAIWDERMYEIFGLKPPHNNPNQYLLSILHPEDKDNVSKKMTLLLNPQDKNNDYQDEYRILLNKEIKHIATQGLVLRNKDGSVQRIIGTCLDITERKRADQVLQESEERFRVLSESAFEGIAITEKGKVINANNKMAEMLNIKFEELVGMNAMDFVAPESRGIVEKYMKMKIEEPYEHLAITKDGRIFPVEVRGKSIPYEGKMYRVTAIRDITEQKKLQGQLIQAQKMESIGQLAAGIAHDYNNILTIINGFAQLASIKATDNLAVKNYLSEILSAGDRAAKLTSQLLTFSRKQIIEPKILDVNSVIKRMDKMLHTIIGENIKLTMELSEQLSPIKADITQIEQILVNLAINARDAITEKKTVDGENQILIETNELYLDKEFVKVHPGSSIGDHIIISVCDTGTGMNKEQMSKVFEPFFTTKEEGKGTGLGLSTVYGIVKQNNGTIYVNSEPGQGTTFNIYWPGVLKTNFQLQEKIIEGKITGGNESIMVVEDDKSIIEFVNSFLSSLGYKVFTAFNGKDALAFSKKNPGSFQLLLTDVIMPKMNGKELADELMKITPDLKVIYASGYSGEHISKSGVLEEGLNFINKPYSMHTLAKKIRDVLDKA